MSCTNGSRKRGGARDYINTNEIGVLCALFDVEGALCRLLDLIPEAIQKIASRKFDKDDTLDFLEEMLKKVAKRTVGLIYDELVNGIDVAAFCELEPPPLPEPVSFADVFIFIADLVPILGYFFTVNEILTGESTKLLDKIVGFWLHEQWFKNCECIPSEPDPENPAPPSDPPINIPDCGEGCPQRPCNKWVAICNGFDYRGFPIHNMLFCLGFRKFTYTFSDGEWIQYYVSANDTRTDHFISKPYIGFYLPNPSIASSDYGNSPLYFNYGDGWSSGNSNIPSPSYIPPCPPCFIEEIEETKEFCALFPDDPICLSDDSDDGGCGVEYVFVEEFVKCDLPTRTSRLKLNVNGRDVPVTVSEFVECDSDRISKTVSLFECIKGVDVFGCNDPTATNYNPEVTINNGTCEYPEINYGCTDPDALNYNPDATSDDGSCIYEVYGCTDASALNYDPAATSDDGSCEYEDTNVYGCTDPDALNYNPDATSDDSSCEFPPEFIGCTNPYAINFNPSAKQDDGNCIIDPQYIGCADPNALNYNPNAVFSDGSCIYE